MRTRNHGNFINRRITGRKGADKRVSRFVEGDDAPLFFVFFARFLFKTDAYLVDRIVKVGHQYLRMSVADGKQGCFVYDVCKVGARKPDGTVRKRFEVDFGVEFDVLRVNAQDFFPAFYVGAFDRNLPVKAAGAQQRGVENVGTVRRGKNYQAFFVVEAVHFDQQLIERLLPLVVAAAYRIDAAFTDGVQFVDKDNARCFVARLLKKVAHAACADADKHFDKVRTGNAKKRNAGFARNGARQKRFTRSRRADQKHALRNLSADFGIFLRRLQKVDYFNQFFFRFVNAGNIGKTGRNLAFFYRSRAALSRGKNTSAQTAHALKDKAVHHKQNTDGNNQIEQKLQQNTALIFYRLIGDALFVEQRQKVFGKNSHRSIHRSLRRR